MEIVNLFPTAVLRESLERDFTDKELELFSSLKTQIRDNSGNFTSISSKILEIEEFADLKKACLEKAVFYLKNIIAIPDTIEPYITLSWMNFTNNGESHHQHSHSNSIVSGVLYVNADRAIDKIHFFREVYQAIDLNPTNFNSYNSEIWWIPVGIGDIIIFPSSLKHGVMPAAGNHTRISLAFNVFVQGQLGSEHKLTKLKL